MLKHMLLNTCFLENILLLNAPEKRSKKSYNYGGKEKLDVDSIPELIQCEIVFNIVPYLLISEDPMKSSNIDHVNFIHD